MATTLQPLQTYAVTLLTSPRLSQTEVQQLMESAPPQLSNAGTWTVTRFLEVRPNGFWKFEGKWNGKPTDFPLPIPFYTPALADVSYLEAVGVIDVPSTPFTMQWFPVLSRALLTGHRYRFLIAGPNELDSEKTQSILKSKGWAIESVDLPPAETLAALTRFGQAGALPPKAWLVTATWTGKNVILPASETSSELNSATITYGELTEQRAVDLPPQAVTPWQALTGTTSGTAQVPASPVAAIAAFAVGALAIGGVIFAWQRARVRRNPIKYEATVRHNEIPIHVHFDTVNEKYCADYRALDRQARGEGGVACASSAEQAIGMAKRKIDSIVH